LLSLLLLLFALLSGYGVRNVISDQRSESLALWLSRYVIYVALPAMVLIYVPRITLDTSVLVPVYSAWGLFVLSSLAVILVGKMARWRRDVIGALLFTVPYGNTSFLGVPFTKVFFGDKGLPYTLIYDQIGSFLILSTIGVVVLAFYTSQKASLLQIIKKVLTFPAFVALVVAFFLHGVEYPVWLGKILSVLADSLSPVAMIAIGLQLKLRFEAHEKLPFGFAVVVKLLAAPLVLLMVFTALGVHGIAAQISVFEAGMAPMVSSSMMAILAGLNPKFTASVLGYGIVLSFITLPVAYWVIAMTNI
jgi:predicted permease